MLMSQEADTRQHNYDHDVERLNHLWEQAQQELFVMPSDARHFHCDDFFWNFIKQIGHHETSFENCRDMLAISLQALADATETRSFEKLSSQRNWQEMKMISFVF